MRFAAAPSRRRQMQRITLNLASMIDVTFLLLIYFLLTTVLAVPEDKLTPTLQVRQEREQVEAADFQPHIVEVSIVNGQPAYAIGARVLRTREALREVLDGLDRESGVFVSVHDHVPVGFAVAAVQTARDAGYDQVTYVPK
jgi:biopolymer transport protein ExbD